VLICLVVGARPNFMKIAPVAAELRRRGRVPVLVHTGQHYDEAMSKVFFDELGMPVPDIDLGVGSDGHARQTAAILVAFDEALERIRPGMVVVGGDVNSTVAAALAAAKRGIPVAHVEAGLRSFDRSMPEEINRVATDHLSDLLFTTEESANENLRREGLAERGIHFVGNCMVDTLLANVEKALAAEPWRKWGLSPGGYALATMHRPSNVDEPAALAAMLEALNEVSRRLPLLFPVHPRTRARLEDSGVRFGENLFAVEPQPYLAFLGLMARARLVLTDSGGIQEETTALGVPCLTLRRNTERPVTVTLGTNRLVGSDLGMIRGSVASVLAGDWGKGDRPPLWDGLAARRIVDVLESFS
jgi:UDP-N-acetylglucosamine 2-epimerase (non-hydrolysing)